MGEKSREGGRIHKSGVFLDPVGTTCSGSYADEGYWRMTATVFYLFYHEPGRFCLVLNKPALR